MSLIRIYYPAALTQNQYLLLPLDISHRLLQVRRLTLGASFYLFNGLGDEYSVQITVVKKKQLEIKVNSCMRPNNESPLPIYLAQGISKGSKMEYTLQKGTELGITGFYPLLCDYSTLKIKEDNDKKKTQRWQEIIISASEQSQRTRLPTLHPPQTLANFLEAGAGGRKFILSPQGALTFNLIKTEKPPSAVILLVGPEGGFSKEEVKLAMHYQVTPLQIGPRLFRTETAGLVGTALFQSLWGDY